MIWQSNKCLSHSSVGELTWTTQEIVLDFSASGYPEIIPTFKWAIEVFEEY